MSTASSIAYLKLKSADARKLGRNGGSISFLILADADRKQLYLSIIGNEGGGQFSTEIVGFDALQKALPADQTAPFAAKMLARAFKGKSANQPSFCAAVLRSLGLLGPVENKPHLHVVTGDWAAFTASMLALKGEPYVPPVKSKAGMDAPATSTAAATEAPTELDPADGAEPVPVEATPAITEMPEPAKGRKGRKPKDDKRQHPTQSPEESEDAHPA
jgi:hypothetical protein